MKDLVRNLPLRTKVLFVFAVFLIVTLGVILLSRYYFKQREQIKTAYENAHRLDLLAIKAMYYQDEIMLKEAINPLFFESESSGSVDAFQHTMHSLNHLLSDLDGNTLFLEDAEMQSVIDTLTIKANELETGFESIVSVIRKRGFKNYGVEGEMRDQAHLLEDEYPHVVPPEQLLSLRRHEKDFIIRREEKYVGRFETQYRIMRNQLYTSEKMDNKRAAIILDKYFFLFKELVALEKRIGLNQQHGLKAQVEETSLVFQRLVNTLLQSAESRSASLLSNIELYVLIGIIGFALITVALGVVFVRGLTHRLLFVSDSMGRFVQSNFTQTTLFPQNIGNDEIGKLAKNFQVLEDEIVVHFANYRNKVEKRTMELLKQKSIIEKSKRTIEQHNQDMVDSIKYAKRIQDSVLPARSDMSRLLKNYFVMYKPKDIVSGDFYWVDFRDGCLVVAVGDCTGHGVPGAFMSILGNNFLNQAVNEHGLTDPGLILGFLNLGITTSLEKNRQDTMVRDGMDISIVSIHMESGKMKFGGAQRPLFVLRGDELVEFKGDRNPIGGAPEANVQFSESTLQMEKGDKVYLFSDGYADQFGGEYGKKFKRSTFKEMVLSFSQMESMYDQKRMLEKKFDAWKGAHEQVDDVCVFGFEFLPEDSPSSSFEKVAKVQIPAQSRQNTYQYPSA